MTFLSVRSQKNLTQLYPDFGLRIACVIRSVYEKTGLGLQISEGIRNYRRQNQLFETGRKSPGAIVTNAKGGESPHHYGIAADLIFTGADPYLERLKKSSKEGARKAEAYWLTVGETLEEQGCEWGGRWKGLGDKPHGQITYGLSISQMQRIFETKRDLAAVWAEFDKINKIEVGRGYTGKDAPFKAVPYWYVMGEEPKQGETK